MTGMLAKTQVAIIGGGQSGLAVGYLLQQANIDFVILDKQVEPGGAWLHTWRSLQLFSPGVDSSLPGFPFPKTEKAFPRREEVIAYLRTYEEKYKLPVKRPVSVRSVIRTDTGLLVKTNQGSITASAVVSCTGTWESPHIPPYPGSKKFLGQQIHSAQYDEPNAFANKKVLIVGGGNSGAQILAEVSTVTYAIWMTELEPFFLPDSLNGSALFQGATQTQASDSGIVQVDPVFQGATLTVDSGMAVASSASQSATQVFGGGIVMVDSVKEARSRGVLKTKRPFLKFTKTGVIWPGGAEEAFDVIIWCTGFHPVLEHLRGLGIEDKEGQIEINQTRCVSEPRLWLVGYGGLATLMGVEKHASTTVAELKAFLDDQDK